MGWQRTVGREQKGPIRGRALECLYELVQRYFSTVSRITAWNGAAEPSPIGVATIRQK